MSSPVDLDALDAAHEACKGSLWYKRNVPSDRALVEIARSYPALRDEIKRLRLELAAAKQQIRACHAAAHGSAGIAEDAIGEHLRLLGQARKWTKETLK